MRRPLSLPLLSRVFVQLKEICFSGYEESLFKLAFSLAFYGAFRISELISRNKVGNGGLLLEDVHHSENQLSIYLKFSKTDIFGKGKWIVLNRMNGNVTCPVTCFEEFFNCRPKKGSILLIHEDGKALSIYQFLTIFRKCIGSLGLKEREYASHSFRIGAATQADLWGLSPMAIRKMGRWDSDRYKSYIRPHLVQE
ncbi:hypothetical protein XENTR_v10018681 [Xenopus tropicalis]|nr:hypothetical protein XENTR_v10018681 [Xenopus tropicalis]